MGIPRLKINEFDYFLNRIDLVELRVQRSWFTWTSKLSGPLDILRPLDRILVNSTWVESLSLFHVCAHCWAISNHNPFGI